MIMLIYSAIAIAFLILVIAMRRKARSLDSDEALREENYAPSVSNPRWLHLSERIFDPSDARWLADELAFPKLAKALILGRKRLAIHWLEALQTSFDDTLRTPGLAPSDDIEAGSPSSWQMLWLTLRFKVLVFYALLVVRVFGPYHRLIPSFSWVPFSQGSEQGIRRPAFAVKRISH